LLKRCILALSIVFIFTLLFFTMPLKAITGNQPAYLSAQSVIIVDCLTGATLYAKDPDLLLPPASITKLMTSLLVADRVNLSDTVVVGKEIKGLEGASIGLLPGDRITAENLMYALMMHSSNDAANALAAYATGSIESFVAIMNTKSKEMGLISTNFVNPHGLPAPNHFSSARDISVLARQAMSNPIIQSIVNTKEREIYLQRGNGNRQRVKIQNTNKLLNLYPGVTGIKTGTSIEAGQCLVTYAEWDARKVVVVILNSANRYLDSVYYLDRTYQELQLDRAGRLLLEKSLLSF